MPVNCAICQETLILGSVNASALSCGHVYHEKCLNEWLKTSRSCPHCRKTITTRQVSRLYFDVQSSPGSESPEELLLKLEEARHRLENTQEQLQLEEKKRCKAEEIADDYQMKMAFLESSKHDMEQALRSHRHRLVGLEAENKSLKKYQQEAAKLRERTNALETVKKLVSDNEEEAQRCLAGFESATEPARSLASSVAVLRHDLKSLTKKNSELKTTLLKTRAAAASDKLELSQTKRLLEKEKNKVINSERDCEILHMENKSLREKVRKLEESIVSPSANPKNAALRRLLHESPAPSLDDISIIGCASGSASNMSSDVPLKSKKRSHAEASIGDESDDGSDLFDSSQSSVDLFDSSGSSVEIVDIVKPPSVKTTLPLKKRDFKGSDSKNLRHVAMLSRLAKRTPTLSTKPESKPEYDGFGGHVSRNEKENFTHSPATTPKPLPTKLKKPKLKIKVNGQNLTMDTFLV